MSFKRKWDEFNDSDDDEPAFGRQILPVANLPEDFDGEPCDGLQYLFTVRRDARQLPHITRAANPYEKDIDPPPVQHDARELPSHVSLPSEEWRALFQTRFKNFRENLSQPTIHVQLPHHDYRRNMPDKKERDLWWAFLAGKPDTDWNPPKKPKQSQNLKRWQFGHGMRGFAEARDDQPPSSRPRQESWQTNDEGEVELVLRGDPRESLPTPTGSPAPPEFTDHPIPGPSSTRLEPIETAVYKPREPTPALLQHIDQRMALHLLMYFAHWINLHLDQPTPSSRPVESHARWMFALLSRVEDYISADDMSLLRSLARACLALLKDSIKTRTPKVNGEEPVAEGSSGGFMGERSCWIIFSTIAGVWAQRDLWMDAEEMLKTLVP